VSFEPLVELARLPFGVELHLPKGDLTGTLQICFWPAQRNLNRLASCEGATAMFVRAANMQMFTTAEQPASISMISRNYDADFGRLDLRLRLENLPSESINVFLALLAHLNLTREPLIGVSLSVIGDRVPQELLLVQKGLTKNIIGRPPQLPFKVVEPRSYAWREPIDIWLEFSDSLQPKDVEEIDAVMATWGYLVAMGGFDLATENQEFMAELGSTSHIEPNLVRYSKEYFDAPGYSIDSAVNCARGLGRLGLRVISLTIEQ